MKKNLPKELRMRYFLKEHIYSNEIGYIYTLADLVISRSGANTFFELVALKKRNKALRNGDEGGKVQPISTNRDSSVFVFVREKENDKVLVICNLTAKPLEVKMKSPLLQGQYSGLFTGEKQSFGEKAVISLKAWEYLVFEK